MPLSPSAAFTCRRFMHIVIARAFSRRLSIRFRLVITRCCYIATCRAFSRAASLHAALIVRFFALFASQATFWWIIRFRSSDIYWFSIDLSPTSLYRHCNIAICPARLNTHFSFQLKRYQVHRHDRLYFATHIPLPPLLPPICVYFRHALRGDSIVIFPAGFFLILFSIRRWAYIFLSAIRSPHYFIIMLSFFACRWISAWFDIFCHYHLAYFTPLPMIFITSR